MTALLPSDDDDPDPCSSPVVCVECEGERLWLTLQIACEADDLPPADALLLWAEAALAACEPEAQAPLELTLRVVDRSESRALNRRYRAKDAATNILSFPWEPPAPELAGLVPLLGDLVVCAPLVQDEALAQGKPPEAHWAHLIVHGVLHLRGFDHVDEEDAVRMESLEVSILAGLGYPDPYRLDAVPEDVLR